MNGFVLVDMTTGSCIASMMLSPAFGLPGLGGGGGGGSDLTSAAQSKQQRSKGPATAAGGNNGSSNERHFASSLSALAFSLIVNAREALDGDDDGFTEGDDDDVDDEVDASHHHHMHEGIGARHREGSGGLWADAGVGNMATLTSHSRASADHHPNPLNPLIRLAPAPKHGVTSGAGAAMNQSSSVASATNSITGAPGSSFHNASPLVKFETSSGASLYFFQHSQLPLLCVSSSTCNSGPMGSDTLGGLVGLQVAEGMVRRFVLTGLAERYFTSHNSNSAAVAAAKKPKKAAENYRKLMLQDIKAVYNDVVLQSMESAFIRSFSTIFSSPSAAEAANFIHNSSMSGDSSGQLQDPFANSFQDGGGVDDEMSAVSPSSLGSSMNSPPSSRWGSGWLTSWHVCIAVRVSSHPPANATDSKGGVSRPGNNLPPIAEILSDTLQTSHLSPLLPQAQLKSNDTGDALDEYGFVERVVSDENRHQPAGAASWVRFVHMSGNANGEPGGGGCAVGGYPAHPSGGGLGAPPLRPSGDGADDECSESESRDLRRKAMQRRGSTGRQQRKQLLQQQLGASTSAPVAGEPCHASAAVMLSLSPPLHAIQSTPHGSSTTHGQQGTSTSNEWSRDTTLDKQLPQLQQPMQAQPTIAELAASLKRELLEMASSMRSNATGASNSNNSSAAKHQRQSAQNNICVQLSEVQLAETMRLVHHMSQAFGPSDGASGSGNDGGGRRDEGPSTFLLSDGVAEGQSAMVLWDEDVAMLMSFGASANGSTMSGMLSTAVASTALSLYEPLKRSVLFLREHQLPGLRERSQ